MFDFMMAEAPANNSSERIPRSNDKEHAMC